MVPDHAILFAQSERLVAEPKHVKLLAKGAKVWNVWRADNPGVRPELRGLNFEKDIWEDRGFYDLPHLEGYDFSGAMLNQIDARNSYFHCCCFDDASLNFADLCFSTFDQCSFLGVSMRVTKIGSASFLDCRFENADLGYCSAEDTDFSGSHFVDTGLHHMSLIKSRFVGSTLERVYAYGTSAWDLDLRGARQEDIFLDEDRSLLIDDIEVAQFVHLFLRNEKVRDVIDTITSKMVLILGRFTATRKPILEALRQELRAKGYLPVIFDFEKPRSRNMTETVSTLAHLARFVIVDLSDPKSVPHELASIVPALPSVPVQPLIIEGESPYAMFEGWSSYPWVQGILTYSVANLQAATELAVERCELALQARDAAVLKDNGAT